MNIPKTKTCSECNATFANNLKACPSCGAPWFPKFVLEPDEILLSDERGKEVAISPTGFNQYAVRVSGKPTAYCPNYESVFKHIRSCCVSLTSQGLRDITELIRIEIQANEFIRSCAEVLSKYRWVL